MGWTDLHFGSDVDDGILPVARLALCLVRVVGEEQIEV